MDDPFFHLKTANIQLHSIRSPHGVVPMVLAAEAERMLKLLTDTARTYSQELDKAGHQMLEIHEENKELRKKIMALETKISSWSVGESAPVAADDLDADSDEESEGSLG